MSEHTGPSATGYTDAQGRPELVMHPDLKRGRATFRTTTSVGAAADGPVIHLRSAARPAAARTTGGRTVVRSECGLQVDREVVDNEHATCPDCAREVSHRG